MNSITRSQLTALLLITDIFALICFGGGLSLWTALGYAAGTALQLGAMLLIAPLKLPKWLRPLFLAYMIFYGSVLLKRLWAAADVTFIPYETSSGTGGKLLITGLIALVCLYVSSAGMKAAARSAVIAAAAGILFLLIDLTSALIHSDFGNISASEPYGTFTGGLLLSVTASGLPIALLTLLPLVKSSRRSAVLQYYICRLLVCTAVISTTLLVTGRLMKIADFPVILAAQLSQPFSTQRIDPLFLILFAVFGVFALTSQVMTGAYLVREIVPKFRKWRSTAVISVTVLGAAAAVFLTGCSSSGLVHDKLYLRSIGIDGDNITMSFFSDDKVISVKSGNIPEAKAIAELEAGKPIVTGFTEMIVLGDCSFQRSLGYMLKTWKVSPSCMVVHSNHPDDTLKNGDTEQLEGSVKQAIAQNLAHECGIADILGRLLTDGTAEVPVVNKDGFCLNAECVR